MNLSNNNTFFKRKNNTPLSVYKYRFTQECEKNIVKHLKLSTVVNHLWVPLKKTKSLYKSKFSPFDVDISGIGCYCFIVSDKKKMFKCFHTGNSGNVINFVEKFMGTNRNKAIEFLLVKYGLEKYKDIERADTKSNEINQFPF